jgi:hypothetical protein
MYDSDNRKNNRREKIISKNFKKNKISEEQKFLSKVKKEKKQKIEHIREEELWEDWEEFS